MRRIPVLLSLLVSGVAASLAGETAGTLENDAIAWHWCVTNNHLQAVRLEDKLNGGALDLAGEYFQVQLADGSVLKASDFALLGPPRLETLQPEPASSVLARRMPGRQLVARMAAAGCRLSIESRVTLRQGAGYLRQEITMGASDGDVLVKRVTLFEQPVPGAGTVGAVDGSPVVADNFFIGYEHPMAQNSVQEGQVVRCSFLRNAVLQQGESLTQSLVLGVAPRGQLRRGFQAYLERERAHPYRPFLHYNCWFDIAFDWRKFTEAESLAAIECFGNELVRKRGVPMQSFLMDDGWDDSAKLWSFHSGFPDGFSKLEAAASHLHAALGVWLSPFGGYDVARAQRLAYGSQFGFETNASGFSLAGPKYYSRFRDICREMIEKYGVNMFKFDGLAAGSKAGADGRTRDGDAMLRLVAELRALKPDLYINQTTGTWPSPFWLLHVDSTWRGGEDRSFHGAGSSRQQWITYRDWQTYQNVVQRGPLYPLNSLMLHGIILATNALGLETSGDQDFADEVHSFFGSGTQLQELYLTPGGLNQQNWDDLAEAAKWSSANADVLVDTHWIGGDPGKGEVYGWASWVGGKAILVLRNPADKPAGFTADARMLLDLPPRAPKSFVVASPWKKDRGQPPVELRVGEPHTFTLEPFQVRVLATPH